MGLIRYGKVNIVNDYINKFSNFEDNTLNIQ